MSIGPETASEPARTLLSRLTGSGPIRQRLMIVVAHPDDETIAIGGQLWRMHDALLVHVTDGAPRDGEDARRHGFSACADYAAARREELAEALIAGEAARIGTAAVGLPDQEAVLNLAQLSRQLLQLMQGEPPAAVLTHAYEGGHPDHDAAAFAVHTACRLLPAADRPALIDMPFYHAEHGAMVTGKFLPSATPETTVPLAKSVLRRKQAMADCFYTQHEILRNLALTPERFRAAPAYDFRKPPHSGELLYETWGWDVTGADWRRHAGEALVQLGLS